MHIRYGALALAIAAALSTCAFAKATGPEATIKAQVPTGSSGGRPHFKFPSHAKPNGGSVLYDQTATAENGVPVQDFQSAFDPFDSEAADDFVVTDAAGWSVSAFNFQVAFIDQFGAPAAPPANALYNVDVYADAVGVPGTFTCSYTGVAGIVDATNTSLTIALPSSCALAQGTYWVSMTPVFDYPPQAFWSNASGAAIGNGGLWRNPSDGFGTGCSAWSEPSICLTSSGFAIGGGDPNYLFQVIGAVGSASGCGAGQLCLVSTVGTDTSAGACAASDTIDATVGDQLNFCYTITNNTGIELDYQTLQNNIDGTLLSQSHQALPPGGTYQFNHIETVGVTNTYNATWRAQDIPSGYFPTVESGGNCSDSIFADGFDGAAAPCNGSAFIDITGTGLALSLSDDASANVSMPFSFDFYGYMSNEVTISNNGGAIFNSPWAPLDFVNVPLPAPNLPGPPVAYAFPLWDDFADQAGQVYTDTRGVAPNRQFVVEWYNRVHYDGASNTDGATFELILNENGTLQFEYADVEYTAINNLSNDPDDCTGGLCATIGLQKDTNIFSQFAAFEAAVTDNSGILWAPTSPQIFTASDTVTVSVGAPQIVVNPNSLTGTVTAGSTSSLPFAIENHGDRDLNWALGEAAASNLHFPPPGTRFAMPLGDPEKLSSARAPIAASAKAGQSPSIHVPLINSAVPTFAADIFQLNFETFDALAPQTVAVVASINDGTAYVGGAFIDGDFSKLYAVAGDFGSNPSNLYTIDTTSGVPTLIGSAANALGEGYSGLAYDATSGNLYAATSTCGTASDLWTIDPATAAPSAVGEIIGAPCIVAIAINGQGEMYGLDIATDSLYAIDKTNGNAALIGSIGFNANYAQDMAFDQSTGVLYLAGFDFDAGTDSIYTLDLQTGTANIVGPIGPLLGEVDAMGIETVGGPCMQPQDLPWLSLSPIAGTTLPLGSTPVSASIDGTGSMPGDTLSGTVCAMSNDPASHTVATPITVNVVGIPPIPPTLTKAFSPTTVSSSTPSTLTITLGNSNAATATLTAALIDAFPPGVVVASTPNASTTCGGALTATAGAGSVTLDASGSAIPASGACAVMVDVTAATGGSYANSIPAGALQTSAGSNTTSADATLQVLDAPTMTKAFSPAAVAPGIASTLTITLANSNPFQAVVLAPLTDTFPAGLFVAGAPNASTTCGSTVNALGGDGSITMDNAGAAIPAGGSCTVTVDVVAPASGSYPNSIPAGALQTNVGANAASADATLAVAPVAPTIAKAFNPSSVTVNTPSTLTITLGNANAAPVTLATSLTDTFPSGLVVAPAPNASTTCGGAITAVAGTDSVSLDATGASIPASGSCTIQVDVESNMPGSYANDIPAGALLTSAGANGAPADASLDVTP